MGRKRIAIITARGGSKGVPRKNIIEIEGKPLIAYSILAGLEAKNRGVLERVIVSTDDQEIADVSKQYGAEVPFMRPDYLASDKAKSIDVLLHAINYYQEKGISYDDILLLQPTTPLRDGNDIIQAFSIYETEHADSLISCYREDYICDLVTYNKLGNIAVPLNEDHNKGIRRQEIKPIYVRNGAIYITNVKYMLREKQIFGGRLAMYEMPKEKSINIDTFYDLKMAKVVMQQNT